MKTEEIKINTPFITLDNALKLKNLVPSGGYGKLLIQDGMVSVNGEVCYMRGKKLRPGDVFCYENVTYEVKSK